MILAREVRKEATDALDYYDSMLTEGTLSDITLQAGGQSFPVHKLFLASRSPVFEAMFRYNVKETAESRVVIEDIDADVIRQMLKFLYTGRVENWDDWVFELYVVANKVSYFLL